MPPFLRRGSIGDCRKIVRFSKRPVLPQTSTKGVVALSEVKHEQMLDARSNMPMWTVIGGSKSWCSKIEHSRNLICLFHLPIFWHSCPRPIQASFGLPGAVPQLDRVFLLSSEPSPEISKLVIDLTQHQPHHIQKGFTGRMILQEANSFVLKILPITPLDSKIWVPYTAYLSDSIRPGGEGEGHSSPTPQLANGSDQSREMGRDLRLLAAGSA